MAKSKFATRLVPLDALRAHPRNPQQGDVRAVITSIATDGWHGVVTVRKPSDDREGLQVLVGHTRWRALATLNDEGVTIGREHLDYAALAERVALPPAGKIPVQYVDLDDAAAVRKMLADNRASALSLVDTAELQPLLAELAAAASLAGSLYDVADFNRLSRSGAARDTASEGLTPEDRLDAYRQAGLRSVILPLDAADYDRLTANMHRLRDVWGVSTVAEVAQRAVAEAAADATS